MRSLESRWFPGWLRRLFLTLASLQHASLFTTPLRPLKRAFVRFRVMLSRWGRKESDEQRDYARLLEYNQLMKVRLYYSICRPCTLQSKHQYVLYRTLWIKQTSSIRVEMFLGRGSIGSLLSMTSLGKPCSCSFPTTGRKEMFKSGQRGS